VEIIYRINAIIISMSKTLATHESYRYQCILPLYVLKITDQYTSNSKRVCCQMNSYNDGTICLFWSWFGSRSLCSRLELIMLGWLVQFDVHN